VKLRLLCISILAVFWLVSCNEPREENEEKEYDLEVIHQSLVDLKKTMLEDVPALQSAPNDFEVARIIRGNLRSRLIADTNSDLDYMNPLEVYLQTTREPKKTMQCAGMVTIYSWALAAFGIRSRVVGLYNNLDQRNEPNLAHSVAEIYINEKWIASDIAYNLQWQNLNGDYLSYFEANALYKNDPNSIQFVHNSGGLPP
jgi:hypothetical protein